MRLTPPAHIQPLPWACRGMMTTMSAIHQGTQWQWHPSAACKGTRWQRWPHQWGQLHPPTYSHCPEHAEAQQWQRHLQHARAHDNDDNTYLQHAEAHDNIDNACWWGQLHHWWDRHHHQCHHHPTIQQWGQCPQQQQRQWSAFQRHNHNHRQLPATCRGMMTPTATSIATPTLQSTTTPTYSAQSMLTHTRPLLCIIV